MEGNLKISDSSPAAMGREHSTNFSAKGGKECTKNLPTSAEVCRAREPSFVK